MKYHLVTAALLLAAGVLYIVGFSGGVVAMIATAVALEIAFWIRIVRGKRPTHVKVPR